MRKYIDAEKVIEELSKVPWYNRDDERQAVRIVREFSAADVQEVRRGRWIDAECYSEGCDDGYICSECRRITYRTRTPYCPNCGARMIDDCTTCPTAQNTNLEDDDSPCRDCEVE